MATVLTIALICTYYAYPGLPAKVTDAIADEQFGPPDGGIGQAPDGRWVQGFPPRGVEAATQPLGAPAPLATAGTEYQFMHKDAHGTPVAYDPCRPIHYVTRADNAPPGSRQLITDAFAAASTATGLVFVDDGTTVETYTAERSSYQPDLYGKRWAPVLLNWTTTAEEPRFTAAAVPGNYEIAGLAGSQAIAGSAGSAVYVTGIIKLNARLFGEMLGDPASAANARGVVEHEIGHVLGLDHVQDPHQLMYEHGQHVVTSYAAGDLTGLAQLGQGRCFPNH
ncbi:matrixin family metalloprotease [Arthrobacter sp. LAPM80]|uniref:matrixin family metalloprotease n=1 Tax=Arthrobacter sp. LAPM80 TaxID=3141788 RepID=UPI00398A81E7